MSNSPTSNPKSAENHFFEHFATLATAPDGIARLRELILQLAVQGKLGTQDAGDEPAAKLIERIRKEKKQLITDGKIRQEQSLEPIEIGEFQKNLPPKWQLSKLGEYSLIIMGQSPESKYYNEHGSGLPFYQGKSEFGKLFPKPRVWCETPRKIAQKNDILISVRAPVGPTNICPSESCIGRGLTALRSLSETSHFFLLYSLRASEKLIAEMGVGSTFSAISKKDLDNFVIAIPPLAEQHRIVAKVDRLMALCDELESRQRQERAGCLKLGTASFAGLQNAESPEEFGRQWAQVCDAFDLILDCPENVAVLRQTILQLAVQGRLSTNADSIGWKKEPLVNLVTKLTNGYVGPTRFIYVASGIPYILSRHLKNHKIFFDGRTFISEEFNQKNRRSILQKGDVLLVQSGDIGNSAVVDEDHVGHNCHALIVMTPVKEKLNGHYLSIFFASPEGRTQAIKIQTGMTLKHLNCRDVKKMVIPLPPLAEQYHIVVKVDALMALCDALEARLKERAGMQGRLAGAVVKQVAG